MTAVLYAYGPDIDAVAAVRANAVTNARNNQQAGINQGHQPPNGPSLRSWQRPLQEGFSGAKAAQTHEAAGFFTSSIRAHFTAS